MENYETLQPVVSEMVMQDGNHGAKYVLVNEYGGAGLKDFMTGLTWDENADVGGDKGRGRMLSGEHPHGYSGA